MTVNSMADTSISDDFDHYLFIRNQAFKNFRNIDMLHVISKSFIQYSVK